MDAEGPEPKVLIADNLSPRAAEILEIRIALGLSDAQAARLETISDSTRRLADSLAARAGRAVSQAGANPDPGSLLRTIRPLLDAIRANTAWALKEAEAALTEAQTRDPSTGLFNRDRFMQAMVALVPLKSPRKVMSCTPWLTAKAVAEQLGISRATFYRRLADLNIPSREK